MDAKTVEIRLSAGELVALPADSLNVRSSAYSVFLLVCDKEETYTGFVTCTCCKKVIKHDLHLSGTTHLNRHASTHSKATMAQPTTTTSQSKITGFITNKKVISATDVAALRTSLAYFYAADLRPFSAVQGSGFQHLAQTLIGIGSKYGNISAKDILPSRTTVAEVCRAETEVARAELVKVINTYVKRYGIIGVTTDMWQEEYKKKNFVAVTVHMLQSDGMVTRVLTVYQFPFETQKTAENIRLSLNNMAELLSLSDMAVHFYFVTDQGSNIKAALSGKYQRLACACHCLSTALKHALPGGPGDQGNSEELKGLQQTVDEVKALVRYIKKSGLNATLKKSVVQENDTRWNSMLMMLESVIAQETQIKDALQRNGQGHRIEHIDFSLVKQFTAFLQPLKTATKLLEGDSYPTLQHIVLQREKLLQHARPQPLDSPLLTQLKCRLRDSLQTKFEVTGMHNLALFMHPAYKGLRRLSATDRDTVYSMARSYMEMLNNLDNAVVSPSTTATSTQTGSVVGTG